MPINYERKRILIWGKTAPELSIKYYETVCTGGVTEEGEPIRLYPLSPRYLDTDAQFKKYQWVTIGIKKSDSDTRPESYKVDHSQIVAGEIVPPDKYGWSARRSILFQKPSWQFESVEALQAEQARSGRSIGIVTPRQIKKVSLRRHTSEERQLTEEKREKIKQAFDRAKRSLFEELVPRELKNIWMPESRVVVDWHCENSACSGHSMQILDWEAAELQRRFGDQAAVQRIQDVLDLSKNDVRFFLGNMFMHQTRFCIAGIFWPKRAPKQLFAM